MRSQKLVGGSTGVVVYIDENKIVFANTGDSRAVLYNEKAEIVVTEDHYPQKDSKEGKRVLESGGILVCIYTFIKNYGCYGEIVREVRNKKWNATSTSYS
jgi:hypothetical protein